MGDAGLLHALCHWRPTEEEYEDDDSQSALTSADAFVKRTPNMQKNRERERERQEKEKNIKQKRGKKKERERERDRHTDRHTDREREKETSRTNRNTLSGIYKALAVFAPSQYFVLRILRAAQMHY